MTSKHVFATVSRSRLAHEPVRIFESTGSRRWRLAACLGLGLVGVGRAQTPVLLPNTITSIAGQVPTPTRVNSPCPTNAQFTATDAVGNGCPAANAVFGGNERSMTVDPLGNIYIAADSSNPQTIRRIDARTGTISIFAGAGSGNACYGSRITVDGTVYNQTDKLGDNCPVAYSGGFNAARGLGSDPYGNIIIPVAGDYVVHLVCTTVSPLCSATQAQVNLMRNIAGCTPSYSAYGSSVGGTTVGSAGDGTLATQFSGTCTTGVNQPRQAAGDKWENIYFTDNGNSRIRVVLGVPSIMVGSTVVVNPLYAAMALFTATSASYAAPTQGFIYPIAGGGTACAGATDVAGDGCPFINTTVGSTTYVQGIAVDQDGDFLFADGQGRLRTIYMGGTAIRSALAANGVAAPQLGYSYALLGNGSTFLYYNSGLTGVYLGSQVSLQPNATQRLAVDAAGNVYIGDQAQVLFYDIYTGYVRRLGGGTQATSCNSSALGDGCPIQRSLFGAPNAITSVNLDNLGNLYIQDLTNKLIRRVSAATLPTTAVNGSLVSSLVVHAPGAGSSASVAAAPSSEFAVGAGVCPAANADGSVDCAAPVTFTPKLLGQRTDPIAVTTTVGSAATAIRTSLQASATGSALVFDTAGAPATSAFGTAATGNSTLMVDGDGNSYVSGTQGISKLSGSTVTPVSATPARYLAVDAAGNVYATNGSATSLAKYVYNAAANSYSATSVSIPSLSINGALMPGYSGPLAVDANGVVYLADLVNKQVIKFSQSSGESAQLTQTALVNPVALTQDSYGNLLVLDGTSLLKIPAAGFAATASSPVANPTVTFPNALVQPTSVAVDQGENVYVADGGNVSVLSLAGAEYAIPGVTGTSVAVDGAGDLFTAAATVPGVTRVLRSAEAHDFGTDVSTAYVGVLSNAGASASTGFNQTDSGGNYSVLAPATPLAATAPTCNLSSTALAGGASCNASFRFAPTAAGSGAVPNIISLLPAANSIGALSLNGTKSGNTATTMVAITGASAGLVYSPGIETTFTVTVTQSMGAPAGSVAVSVDGGAAASYGLTAASASTGTATVTISGLRAGAHTITATYQGSAGIAGSTSPTVSFTIAPASTVVSWTPGATTQPYSAAIGAGVLNATASSGSGAVPGVFVYSATPSGGTAGEIHSASFLPIGTYSLSATFYPTDAVDYGGASASVASYTVTKATTVAAVGASTMLVAADGTGNYSTVQAAVNALPAEGGSVYIKPGTYNGFVTVVQPNVALRGLGGDPAQVVLTHAAGAFSNSGGVYQYTGEFTAANSNGAQLPSGSSLFSGDEGSSTLVVARGVNSAVGTPTFTPNGFYGENFTLANTYNTDTTTQTSTYVANGNCTANAGVARTYNDLFNNGVECASQALAIWITSDLAVLNNVYTSSLQDTVYAASQGSSSTGYVPARQLWFRGKVTGTVDYIFGDAAAVFDHTSIYTVPHGTGVGGTETIEAQNKAVQTGGPGDYLSGYVMNGDVFTSSIKGMKGLEFGRPYGTFSTYIMLNSYVDQVAPEGYIDFSGLTNLPTSTYAEYNNVLYTDPATGSPDLNNVVYLGQGGSSGQGVAGPRETTSQSPGTAAAGNAIRTTLSQAQAQQYYPGNFLSRTVANSSPGVPNWNATAALATAANAFVPSNQMTIAVGSSVTILMRPQTPGLGAVGNGNYTVPTGTYTLTDTYAGLSTTLASGSLDAAGEAYFVSSALAAGTHSLSWSYGGDANFSASSTPSPYVLTVAGKGTATTLAVAGTLLTYGQTAVVTATVSPASGGSVPTGQVTLTVDGGAPLTAALSGGVAGFNLAMLSAGSHSLAAAYSGDALNATSAGSATVAIAKAALTVSGPAVAITYGSPVPAFVPSYSGFAGTDTAASALTGVPSLSTATAAPTLGGTYPILVTQGTLAAANYSFVLLNGSLTITKAATALNLVSSNTGPGLNVPVTFSATLASKVGGTPSGFVSFYNGATLLNNITLSASGMAAYTMSFANAGAANITAVYSGDQNFGSSTSSAAIVTTVTAGFAMAVTPSTVSVPTGQSGLATVQLTPFGNYLGGATLACSGLPADTLCSFSPAIASFAGDNSVVRSLLTISTGVNTSLASPSRLGGGRKPVLAGVLMLPLLLGAFSRGRKLLGRRMPRLLLLLIGSGLLMAGMTGCGTSNFISPAGIYQVTVTATGTSGGATVTQQTILSLTITR